MDRGSPLLMVAGSKPTLSASVVVAGSPTRSVVKELLWWRHRKRGYNHGNGGDLEFLHKSDDADSVDGLRGLVASANQRFITEGETRVPKWAAERTTLT